MITNQPKEILFQLEKNDTCFLILILKVNQLKYRA